MKIAAFTRYGERAASTRQRLLQYGPAMAEAGIALANHPLLDDAYMRAIAGGERPSRASVLSAYAKRLRHLSEWTRKADLIWVYAELLPFLPAALERRIFARGVPVVYDFDDAFFLTYQLNGNPLVRRLFRGKFEDMLARSAGAFCGNSYLQDYARRFAPEAIYLPTVVDTATYVPPPRPPEGRIVIGWIGSPSTWRYVIPVLPALRRVCARHDAVFRVVGAGKAVDPASLDFPQLEAKDWTQASEVADIQGMHIGIMPAVDEIWALGKCGYKLIQYGACGLPVVASPIGAATDIVSDGVSGLLAGDASQWEDALGRLIGDAAARARMGEAGRARVVADYSLATHAPRLIHHLQRFGGGSVSLPGAQG